MTIGTLGIVNTEHIYADARLANSAVFAIAVFSTQDDIGIFAEPTITRPISGAVCILTAFDGDTGARVTDLIVGTIAYFEASTPLAYAIDTFRVKRAIKIHQTATTAGTDLFFADKTCRAILIRLALPCRDTEILFTCETWSAVHSK